MKHDIQLYLDTRRTAGGKDKYPLKIRIGGMGRSGGCLCGLDMHFTKAQYNTMCAERTRPKHRDLWNKIEARLDHADKIVEGMMPYFNAKDFKERFKKRADFRIVVDRTSIISMRDFANTLYLKDKQFPMTVKIKDSVNSILKFVNRDNPAKWDAKDTTGTFIMDIPMRSITPEFCRQYEEWMYNKSKTKTRNGAGINMRHVRILFNTGIEHNILPKEWYPFKRESGEKSEFTNAYVIPNEGKVKSYLNMEENQDFAQLEEFDTEADKRAYIAYFFSFYCNGSNAADFLRFKFSDIQGKYIVFYREKIKNANKSNSKPVKIFLSDELKEFIKRFCNKPDPDSYIFPCLEAGMSEDEIYYERCRFNTRVTRGIQRLLPKVGIDKKVSVGKVRHALANILRKKGVTRELFKEIFGHTSIITADNYFGQFDDEEYEDIFNHRVRLKRAKAA
jgi:site-specific recombinase XerD